MSSNYLKKKKKTETETVSYWHYYSVFTSMAAFVSDIYNANSQNVRKKNEQQQDQGLVTLETSMGNIEIELYWKHAPNTCKNFYELAKRGYYDKTIFHRIVKVC